MALSQRPSPGRHSGGTAASIHPVLPFTVVTLGLLLAATAWPRASIAAKASSPDRLGFADVRTRAVPPAAGRPTSRQLDPSVRSEAPDAVTGLPMAIHDGPELDYQPAIVRSADTGAWLVVFERLDVSSLSGDLYMARSTDAGATWSAPVPIVASERNERHPAVVELQGGGFALFYLVDETGARAFRIHAARSTDGQTWSELGARDLGWETPGEVNPSALVEPDGTVSMAYHRLGGAAYIARSTDGGRTWDRERTRVSPGSAALPRLARRQSDGRYLVTYQTNPGDNDLDLWARVTQDASSWTAPPAGLSVQVNSHDSQPLVLADGTFLVLYARQSGRAFDVVYRTSVDGARWSAETDLTDAPDRYDTQPHGLLLDRPNTIAMVWSHQDSPQPYGDHDVWIWTPIEIATSPEMPAQLALPWAGRPVGFGAGAYPASGNGPQP